MDIMIISMTLWGFFNSKNYAIIPMTLWASLAQKSIFFLCRLKEWLDRTLQYNLKLRRETTVFHNY